jgi:hypothetical protein
MENSGDDKPRKTEESADTMKKGKCLINKNKCGTADSCLFHHFPSAGFLIVDDLMMCSKNYFA